MTLLFPTFIVQVQMLLLLKMIFKKLFEFYFIICQYINTQQSNTPTVPFRLPEFAAGVRVPSGSPDVRWHTCPKEDARGRSRHPRRSISGTARGLANCACSAATPAATAPDKRATTARAARGSRCRPRRARPEVARARGVAAGERPRGRACSTASGGPGCWR